jgi:CheY-like chemotaxis protein
VTEAIGQLKPGADVPPYALAWRIYHVLVYRYIEQSSQCTVAANLGLSIRQLRRQERVAEKLLADHLWAQYHLDALAPRVADILAASAGEASLASGPSGGQEQELDWLRRSSASARIDVPALVAAALKVIASLAEKRGTRIMAAVPDDLPPVTGQLTAARQALLSLLTGALYAVPGGQVLVRTVPDLRGVGLEVRAIASSAAPVPQRDKVGEHLDMARQLVGLFGATLEVLHPKAEGEALAVVLTLPAAERPTVLVIDDNADTLRLFERYLAGSRYQFIGQPDPAQALASAAALAPDVVVLDVMLPGIDGWELLGRLREHPQTSCVPVVVCTILPQESLALTLGAAAFLRKPVSREALLSALDQVADRSSKGPT